MQQSKKTFDLQSVLQMVLQVVKRLCAPIRDAMVEKLMAEEDVLELFRSVENHT